MAFYASATVLGGFTAAPAARMALALSLIGSPRTHRTWRSTRRLRSLLVLVKMEESPTFMGAALRELPGSPTRYLFQAMRLRRFFKQMPRLTRLPARLVDMQHKDRHATGRIHAVAQPF